MSTGTIRFVDVDGSAIWRCPTSLVRTGAGECGEVLSVWREWRAVGLYPNSGGRFCQSGKLVDLFEALDGAERGKQ